MKCHLFRTSDEMLKIYEKELYFLEQCLRVNPKCYSTWHQRCWIMDKMETPDWKRELALCNKFLEYDERNCKKLFLPVFYASFCPLMLRTRTRTHNKKTDNGFFSCHIGHFLDVILLIHVSTGYVINVLI